MFVVELIFKLSVLIAVSVFSGFINSRWKRDSLSGRVLQGLLFGLVALIGMLNPFILSPGIIFDGRSIVISLCALFFGPVSGLIAMMIALIYRIYLGGGGIITGISVIMVSYLIGSLFYYRKNKRQKPIQNYEIYLFGLLVHLSMIGMMAAFPNDMRYLAYKTMSLTILVAYPLATLLIGKILKDQEDNSDLLLHLATNERQFRLLINNMNQGLAVHKIITNEQGNVVDYRFEYINEKYEQITGFRKDVVLGKTILEIRPETTLKTIQKYGEVALSGIPFHFESYSREQNIYFEADIYQPIDNHFAVIVSDITARKLAEREIITKNKILEKINTEKDKLFSIVSHDLRSPLNGILGLTGMIKDETESFTTDHIREIATSIHNSASSLIQLLHGLLEWSKLQRENACFNPQMIPLLSSVQKCVNVLHETAKAKCISIQCNVDGDTRVFADKLMLESVIRNLISNAIKFTPAGGQILINMAETGSHLVTLSVTDNGIGMNPLICDKLFSLSSKINRKGTDGELSSGLGLILCKELIERNGGKIWAQSQEGIGSTFYFTMKDSAN